MFFYDWLQSQQGRGFRGICRERFRQSHDIGKRLVAPFHIIEAREKFGLCLTCHMQVGKRGVDRVGRPDGHAGEAEKEADGTRTTRQKITAADIGEQTDRGFRHRHPGAFADDAQRRPLRHAHAATHDDAVDHGDIGLA